MDEAPGRFSPNRGLTLGSEPRSPTGALQGSAGASPSKFREFGAQLGNLELPVLSGGQREDSTPSGGGIPQVPSRDNVMLSSLFWPAADEMVDKEEDARFEKPVYKITNPHDEPVAMSPTKIRRHVFHAQEEIDEDVPDPVLSLVAAKRQTSQTDFSALESIRHVSVEEVPIDEELARVAADIDKCIQRRRRYRHADIQADEDRFLKERHKPSRHAPYLPFKPSKVVDGQVVEADVLPEKSKHELVFAKGVYSVVGGALGEASHSAGVDCNEFYGDLRRTMKVIGSAAVNSFASKRMVLLEAKFQMYLLLNEDKEICVTKINPHRDFYNVRKVDTHIHHSASMHPKHLLRFIKKKLKKEAERVVIFRDGTELTLKQVFESLKMTAYDLSLDMLDVHADNQTLHRFDRFNLKYNPCGSSRLREIFLKTDNMLGGLYLAQLTKEMFVDMEDNKYQMTELRISIYGRSKDEWKKLAMWVNNNDLYCENNRWVIQVPRLFHVHVKTVKGVKTFTDFLDNIFGPLFEATRDPQSHPEMHLFLQQVIGFDSVDDESLPEIKIWRDPPAPDEWCEEDNLPYSYYIYHMWANLSALNAFRRERGFNTFALRPHAGEAGELDHMVTAFLLSESIAHGIAMRRSPALQHLFYLEQVGLCMSPMSNNALFLRYEKNPFDLFFKRGLNVSLSTDDPLQFHVTKEALIEEYGMAKQVWKYRSVTVDLTSNDC